MSYRRKVLDHSFPTLPGLHEALGFQVTETPAERRAAPSPAGETDLQTACAQKAGTDVLRAMVLGKPEAARGQRIPDTWL